MRNTILTTLLICSLLAIQSCRDDETISEPIDTNVGADSISGDISGFYILNEGNMGMNKASLDFYDYATGTYRSSIYAQANPNEIKELGDVGNDLQIYGNKLYAVINYSNIVEIMDVKTTKKLKTIAINNCRSLAFYNGKAYVSSFSGTPSGSSQLGTVFEIDTLSLQITRQVTVGFQPEEMVAVNGKLFVANSGGYTPSNLDTRVSVIDLGSFNKIKDIDVGPNLFRMALSKDEELLVTSRGDASKNIAPALHIVSPTTDNVVQTLNIPVANMDVVGDSLYYYTLGDNPTYGILDTRTKQIVNSNLITDGSASKIKVPTSIKVHPIRKEFYITDGQNYVASGYVLCFDKNGKMKWRIQAGNIPAHIAFVSQKVTSGGGSVDPDDASRYISRVFEFSPAPGQNVNQYPLYNAGDTRQMMIQKAENSIKGTQKSLISLGGFGGYIVFGFDHTIENVAGEKDFKIWGNAFYYDHVNKAGSCEPGVIMVSADKNANGIPDDEWYEIAGSAHSDPKSIKNYEITYHKPSSSTPNNQYIRWTDNQGKQGYIEKTGFGSGYYPAWIGDNSITFRGTRLPDNAKVVSSMWYLYAFDWGYADNKPNSDELSGIDISWAVDSAGNPVNLTGIDFVKVYSGINQSLPSISGQPPLGEVATDILGAEDLHWTK